MSNTIQLNKYQTYQLTTPISLPAMNVHAPVPRVSVFGARHIRFRDYPISVRYRFFEIPVFEEILFRRFVSEHHPTRLCDVTAWLYDVTRGLGDRWAIFGSMALGLGHRSTGV